MNGSVKIKSDIFAFSFIDVCSDVFFNCRTKMQISNNDHIHRLLPCKENQDI